MAYKNADTNLDEVTACVARLSKKNYSFHLRSKPRATCGRQALGEEEATSRRQVEKLQMATESGH